MSDYSYDTSGNQVDCETQTQTQVQTPLYEQQAGNFGAIEAFERATSECDPLSYMEECVSDVMSLACEDDWDARTAAMALVEAQPFLAQERAEWILKAYHHGFVQFSNSGLADLERLAAGEQAGYISSHEDDVEAPILRIMCQLVGAPIARWIDGGTVGPKPTLTIGSFATWWNKSQRGQARGGSHGNGRAIDLNDLGFTGNTSGVDQVLRDLPRGTYGLGVPFQGDYLDAADKLDNMKEVAEAQNPVPAQAQVQGSQIQVGEGLKVHKSGVFTSAAALEVRDGQPAWDWTDTLVGGNAEDFLVSKTLQDAIDEMRANGSSVYVFPDYNNHLHIQTT
jgi:hypothetical protein